MRKIFYPALAMFCILLVSNCRKISDEKISSFESDQDLSEKRASKIFGVLFNWADFVSDKNSKIKYDENTSGEIAVIKAINGKCVRLAISHLDWSGADNLTSDSFTHPSGHQFIRSYGQFSNAGINVVMNVNWTDGKASGSADFPDANAYAAFLQEVLDTLHNNAFLKPLVVVVENEEVNPNYHTQDLTNWTNYVSELRAAINICKGYTKFDGTGIAITNGGITARPLTYLEWDWLKNIKNLPAQAQQFAKSSMPPSSYYALYPPAPANVTVKNINQIKNKITACKFFDSSYNMLAGLSYVNLHWYEPIEVREWNDNDDGGNAWSDYHISPDSMTAGILDSVINYIHTVDPGKGIFSSETGQVIVSFAASDGEPQASAALTTQMLNYFFSKPAGVFDILCWYDGDRLNLYDAEALHGISSKGTKPFYYIRPTGKIFQKIAGRH